MNEPTAFIEGIQYTTRIGKGRGTADARTPGPINGDEPMSQVREKSSMAESLAHIDILRGLTEADIKAVEHRCRWRRYGAGELVIGHLDDSRDVFFIVGGLVQVKMYSPAGKEVLFREIGPGQVFGEYAAIDGEPRSANVIALTDSVLASMPARTFQEVLHEHPSVGFALLTNLTRQLRGLTERVFEFSAFAVGNRIQAELLRLARGQETSDNSASVHPVPKHAEIAARISTHREAVTRELSRLEKMGLIKRANGRLEIPDIASLEQLVSHGTPY